MQRFFKASSHLALAALLGLAMSACVGVNQANAQGKTKKDKPAKVKTMDDHKMMKSTMMDDEDEADLTRPLTPAYPNASPGSLNLYHWKDYTRKEMEEGSAMDNKSDKMMKHDKMMHDRGSMDDEDDMNVLPLTPGYPNISPGGLHLYHWKDYTRKEMEEGSAMDKKMDKEHMKDKMKMDRDKMMSGSMMEDEDEADLTVPLTPAYPQAGAGSLQLYHWKDYTKKEMMEGSATDKKMEKEHKMDKKKMDRSKTPK